jgi:putative glutamine amidotransferase
MPSAPIIGITCDIALSDSGVPRAQSSLLYADAIARAGGTPILLAPVVSAINDQLALCRGVVLTGGNDPRMEPLGGVTHPRATTMHPRRQEYELALLRALDATPRTPALGICLGMQLMALHAGGTLDQHLPDNHPHAERHTKDYHHPIHPTDALFPFAPACAASNHHQGVSTPGKLRVLATSDDGIIECISDPSRPFYLGVQWHPERTRDAALGDEVFVKLVDACRNA